ncbi:MAG: CPBP family intramembrane metalloprotease [Proteobacteria bacterium]|nr:CPBP family intramembrane metalloprotease [Pseudomonadota bacterium]
MKEKLINSGWARAMSGPGGAATPALVFLAAALVMLLQIPANLVVRAGWVSAGVLLNEVVAVAGVPLFLVYLFRLDASRISPAGRVGASMYALLAIFMLGSVILLDYATVLSETVFPLPDEIERALERLMEAKTPGAVAWKLFLLCLVPAVCEELFFRGFCQGSLSSRWGSAWAIAAASALFALMHGNPYHAHLYFLLGALFGWVFYATASLWAAAFCHAFNNSWTFLNHVRGFEFPLGGPWYLIDIAIAAAAAAAVVVCGRAILRRGRAARSSAKRFPALFSR